MIWGKPEASVNQRFDLMDGRSVYQLLLVGLYWNLQDIILENIGYVG